MRFTLSSSALPAALSARVMAWVLMAATVIAVLAGGVPDAAAAGWQPLPALTTITDVGNVADASASTVPGMRKPGLASHHVKPRRRQSPVFGVLRAPAEGQQALLALQRVGLDVDHGAQRWNRESCTGFPGDVSTCRSGSSRAPPALI